MHHAFGIRRRVNILDPISLLLASVFMIYLMLVTTDRGIESVKKSWTGPCPFFFYQDLSLQAQFRSRLGQCLVCGSGSKLQLIEFVRFFECFLKENVNFRYFFLISETRIEKSKRSSAPTGRCSSLSTWSSDFRQHGSRRPRDGRRPRLDQRRDRSLAKLPWV